MNQKKYDDSIEQFKFAITFINNNMHYKGTSNVYWYISIAYFQIKKYDKSVEYLKILLELNDKDANIYVSLGNINVLI